MWPDLTFRGPGESYFLVGSTGMAKGPRKLTVPFGTKSLTHSGGVYLLHRLRSKDSSWKTIDFHTGFRTIS